MKITGIKFYSPPVPISGTDVKNGKLSTFEHLLIILNFLKEFSIKNEDFSTNSNFPSNSVEIKTEANAK